MVKHLKFFVLTSSLALYPGVAIRESPVDASTFLLLISNVWVTDSPDACLGINDSPQQKGMNGIQIVPHPHAGKLFGNCCAPKVTCTHIKMHRQAEGIPMCEWLNVCEPQTDTRM